MTTQVFKPKNKINNLTLLYIFCVCVFLFQCINMISNDSYIFYSEINSTWLIITNEGQLIQYGIQDGHPSI